MFVSVRTVLIVAFFIHSVNVLLQHRSTCYHLVSRFFTHEALDVQASCVVIADLDLTSNVLTAVFVQLDFITTSMAIMVLVFCVLQVSTTLLTIYSVVPTSSLSWFGQTT